MDVICMIDKSKADDLSTKGFPYIICKTGDTTIYQFIRTPELELYLSGNYSVQEFFINKNLNF